MGKNIQLSIAEPCHENWNRMTAVEQGRFCDSCQKEVIDFTSMSDAEVAAFFKRPSAGSVCGRFMKDQLGRNIAIPKKRIPWVKYFFQFTLPLFFTTLKVNAQKGMVAVKTTTSPVACTKQPLRQMGKIAMIEDRQIKGQIVDEEGTPVPYANIMIKGTSIGAPADNAGQFTFPMKTENDSVILSVSSVGFAGKDVVVNYQDIMNNKRVIIRLEKIMLPEVSVKAWVNELRTEVTGSVVSVTMGAVINVTKCKKDVSIVDPPAPKPTVMKVYPNPVAPGSPVNIDCSKLEESYYSFQLLTLSGQMAAQQEIWIDKDARVLNIPLPKVAAGTYLLSMTSRKSGKRSTNKIVIE